MDTTVTLTEEVAELAVLAGDSCAFQSTLAAATEAVEQALETERQAEGAAISLAHRRLLGALTGELADASAALRKALNAQGRCVLGATRAESDLRVLPRLRERLLAFRLSRSGDARPPGSAPSWWFSLAEAIETLDSGTERLAVLGAGQPATAPARTLAEGAAALLRRHHDRLLQEAERWVG